MEATRVFFAWLVEGLRRTVRSFARVALQSRGGERSLPSGKTLRAGVVKGKGEGERDEMVREKEEGDLIG